MNDALLSNVAAVPDPMPTPLTPTQALRRGFTVAAQGDAPDAGGGRALERAVGEQRRQGFRIGALGLMIAYMDGSELTELPAVYRLPHAPSWFVGICNLHGALIPVFDLARRFGIERDARAKPMLLVLGHGPEAAGVMVDGLPQRLRFGPDELIDNAAVPTGMAHVVAQAAMIDEQLWFDLAVPALLDSLSESSAEMHP